MRDALRLVRLEGYEERKPAQLSGGQQQRVALARAIVFNPSVLLLDEPLSALDRVLREEMQYELRRVHELTGMATVCVTHDRTEALTMSDRVVLLRGGQIVQQGNPREMYDRSASRFAAEFLGEVNRLGMNLVREDGRAVLVDGKGRRIDGIQPWTDVSDGPVDVVIRVENVRLSVPGTARSTHGWGGVVRDAAFLGDGERYVVDADGTTFVARLARGAIGHAVGDRVEVDFERDDVMVFGTDR
jgi:ABC-type Fe3+/spermidine/putrescine transport system ATPase subunit